MAIHSQILVKIRQAVWPSIRITHTQVFLTLALVHAFISSRLDYCNSLLYGINQSLLDKLQAVLRAAARLVMKKLKFDHISDDIRDELHWLPVKQRISFKICMYVRKCLDHEAPAYLSDMLTSVSDGDALRRQSFRRSSRLGRSKNKNSALWRSEFCGVWAETVECSAR